MDTSPGYVKMCDCPEIQGGYEVHAKDFFAWKLPYSCKCGKFDGERFQGVQCDSCGTYVGQPVWLPRQDQLQEMGVGGILSIDLVAEYLECTYDLGFEPESWEQLWLALVMREKHGKTWNGEAWT